jgi:hypothetical protein
MAQAASDPMLLATDLAELLVRKAVPFREAHEVVGKIVGHCTRNQLDLRSLSRADLRGFHPAFDASAGELLDLERSVESRSLTGGTARVRVVEALAAAEADAAADADALARLDAPTPRPRTTRRTGKESRPAAAGGNGSAKRKGNRGAGRSKQP